jgi:branched-chain amino acid aminotransferase
MHKLALLNADFIDAGEASVRASSAAALYGRGVFTTIAIYNGEPFLWDKHCHRLRDNAVRIGFDKANISFESLEHGLRELIAANAIKNGRARITLFDESSTIIWPSNKKDKSGVLILTGDLREQPSEILLTFSPFKINSASPLAGVKSCNYLEHLLAQEEAKKRGFDEAVLLNERGEVTSACMANLFWLRDGKLFTPSLETGCIAGTTREFILENAACVEARAEPDVLRTAESLFISSAGVGIRQVKSLDEKIFGPRAHEILRLLPL